MRNRHTLFPNRDAALRVQSNHLTGGQAGNMDIQARLLELTDGARISMPSRKSAVSSCAVSSTRIVADRGPSGKVAASIPFMVLGAVMAGWTVMMIQIVRGPLREGSAWARSVLINSLVVWFVLDTGMSLALGFPLHALFNVPFALALAIPLMKLRQH